MKQDDTVIVETVAEEFSVPATEIVKAARKASKKKAPKAKRGGSTKTKAKVSKKAAKAPAKAKKGAKKAPKAPKSKLAKKPAKAPKSRATGIRRGPGSPNKIERRGNQTYGKKVAAARKAKGWTGRQLAEKIGCTQPAICNVEKGTIGASEALQAKFKKVLGVPGYERKARAKAAKAA